MEQEIWIPQVWSTQKLCTCTWRMANVWPHSAKCRMNRLSIYCPCTVCTYSDLRPRPPHFWAFLWTFWTLNMCWFCCIFDSEYQLPTPAVLVTNLTYLFPSAVNVERQCICTMFCMYGPYKNWDDAYCLMLCTLNFLKGGRYWRCVIFTKFIRLLTFIMHHWDTSLALNALILSHSCNLEPTKFFIFLTYCSNLEQSTKLSC